MAGVGLLAVAATSCGKKVESTQTSGIATIACDATFENIMSQEIDLSRGKHNAILCGRACRYRLDYKHVDQNGHHHPPA